MDEWEAWWLGEPDKLWQVYHGQQTGSARNYQRRTGLRGFLSRFFWGRTLTDQHHPSRNDLHVPIASDLCATSADLLYANPPSITASSEAATARIERYIDDGLFEQLLTGAETGAAFGGRYHRVTWDRTIADRPFLTTVDADSALPEFRWGHLVAVTFWTVLESDGSRVLRHLERHELNPAGMGLTFHGLYEGTYDNLGMLRPLAEHPVTAPLAEVVGMDGYVTDGITPGLAVQYVPNLTPVRRWRDHHQARNLGRSDLDGVEGLMDALDEVYSAWMRDVRLGKARIFADRDMLDQSFGSAGGAFNLDQEVFTPLEGLAGSMADTVPIHAQQFTIRWQEHQQTAIELTRRILRAARYSAASFEDTPDTDITATEVIARQSQTNTTRNRKARLEKPALQALIVKMLATDQAVYNTPSLDPTDLAVTFPRLVEESASALTQTISTLRSAELMSIETGVRMAHPDWDQTQVDAEVELIKKSQPLASPDAWRPDGEDVTDSEPQSE
ncbi:phage portal protein [Schaalia sp. lx-100]|uniref:phage portal protein n=1 Tax=Schaalia sp. lx-100 TaxID=2899081 RepID=UPI001E3E3096|nr:phage portal protein [Schaalia sp. lx-100]MCD4558233.1 phage portal protein [Schaalia sp. lx-100]